MDVTQPIGCRECYGSQDSYDPQGVICATCKRQYCRRCGSRFEENPATLENKATVCTCGASNVFAPGGVWFVVYGPCLCLRCFSAKEGFAVMRLDVTGERFDCHRGKCTNRFLARKIHEEVTPCEACGKPFWHEAGGDALVLAAGVPLSSMKILDGTGASGVKGPRVRCPHCKREHQVTGAGLLLV